MVLDRNDPDFKAVKTPEDAIKFFEKKGIPLTEDEKAIFYSDTLLKRNNNRKLVKICEVKQCHNGVWCLEKDYCDYHEQEQENLRSLVQQKTSLSNPQEVVKFETWWNKNCSIVINKDSNFRVFLIVWEPSHRSMPEISPQVFPRDYSASQWGTEMRRDNHSSLSNAQSEAEQVRNKLKDHPNPILMIFSSLEFRLKENYSFEKAGIIKYKLPYNSINNPDQYIKPLDIVKIGKEKMFGLMEYEHVAIYLGNKKVCHIYDLNGTKSTNCMKVQIDGWEDFLKNRATLPTRHHSLIPFKHRNRLIEQIVRSVIARYNEGEYHPLASNCEHFVNQIIYGIDFSEQAQFRINALEKLAENIEREEWIGTYDNPFYVDFSTRDISSFISSFNLENNLIESNRRFDNLSKYKTSEIEAKIKEIKNYDENHWNSLIEVPYKTL